MTEPRGASEERDPLRGMRVERVERGDGRSLVYYTWPDEPPEPPEEPSGEGARASEPDTDV